MLSLPHLFFFISFFFIASSQRPSSHVTILTEANFEAEIGRSSNILWFVDFYAPWCGHCKKLDPVLSELSEDVESEINDKISDGSSTEKSLGVRIGKLDATMHKRVADQYAVKGFPTLLYFLPAGDRGKEVHGKYEGPRTKQGFMSFLRRMVSPPVTIIADASKLNSIYDEHPVVFLLSVPESKKDGDKNTKGIIESFQIAAKSSHAVAYFAITYLQGDNNKVSIEKTEKGRIPIEMKNLQTAENSETFDKEITDFVTKNNRALISQFDAHNFKKLGSLGKKMVVAVYSNLGLTKPFFDAFDAVVSSLPTEDSDKYVFGYLDGLRWKGFLKQYGCSKKKLPAILILDTETETYHVHTSASNEDIALVIKDLHRGELEFKKLERPSMLEHIHKKLKDSYPLSLLCIIPVLLLLWSFLMPFPADKKKSD